MSLTHRLVTEGQYTDTNSTKQLHIKVGFPPHPDNTAINEIIDPDIC